MFGDFSVAVMEMTAVEQADDEEVVKLAEKAGIDIRKYYD